MIAVESLQPGCDYLAKRKSQVPKHVELRVYAVDYENRLAKIKSDADDLDGDWRPFQYYTDRYEVITLLKDEVQKRMKVMEEKMIEVHAMVQELSRIVTDKVL